MPLSLSHEILARTRTDEENSSRKTKGKKIERGDVATNKDSPPCCGNSKKAGLPLPRGE